jgi:hypothetical protein
MTKEQVFQQLGCLCCTHAKADAVRAIVGAFYLQSLGGEKVTPPPLDVEVLQEREPGIDGHVHGRCAAKHGGGILTEGIVRNETLVAAPGEFTDVHHTQPIEGSRYTPAQRAAVIAESRRLCSRRRKKSRRSRRLEV